MVSVDGTQANGGMGRNEILREKALDLWVKGSGVEESIFNENVKVGENALIAASMLNIPTVDSTGGYWWVHALSPHSGVLREDIGELRWFSPKQGKSGKRIKYQAFPAGSRAVPILLRVPVPIWEKIAKKYGLTFKVNPEREDLGFWEWIKVNEIALAITEGLKKAAALLSCGIPAISIPGVWNGRIKDEVSEFLQPELAYFASQKRNFILVFDSDLHNNHQVGQALKNLHGVLTASGVGNVYIAHWGLSEGKGIDDLLVNSSRETVQQVIEQALDFKEWGKTYCLPPTSEDNYLWESIDTEKYIAVGDKVYVWEGDHHEFTPDPLVKKALFKELIPVPEMCSKNGSMPGSASTLVNVKNLLEQIKIRCQVRREDVNPPEYLNLKNGVLRLTVEGKELEVELLSHDKSSSPYFTENLGYDYDPDAHTGHLDRLLDCLEESPREIFLKTLSVALNLPAYRQVQGRQLRLCFVIGNGANGKDAIRMLLRTIFGTRGLTSVTLRKIRNADSGSDKFSLAPFEYSRVNWASENSRVPLDTIEVLKAMITGDTITVERKHVDSTQTDPKCVLIMSTNEWPILSGDSKALRSRYCFIKFDKTYSAQPNGEGELKADPRFQGSEDWVRDNLASAGLNALIGHYKDALANGVDYDPLKTNMEEIRRNSCHLWEFLEEIKFLPKVRGKLPKDRDDNLTKLYRVLSGWYVKNHMAEAMMGSNKISPLVIDKYDPIITSPKMLQTKLKKLFPSMKTKKKNYEIYITNYAWDKGGN